MAGDSGAATRKLSKAVLGLKFMQRSAPEQALNIPFDQQWFLPPLPAGA